MPKGPRHEEIKRIIIEAKSSVETPRKGGRAKRPSVKEFNTAWRRAVYLEIGKRALEKIVVEHNRKISLVNASLLKDTTTRYCEKAHNYEVGREIGGLGKEEYDEKLYNLNREFIDTELPGIIEEDRQKILFGIIGGISTGIQHFKKAWEEVHQGT